ncbi:TonB-dependent siderophore receptor [Ramlibacter tataouinensis]|uniref:TonB-dependent siderophore receptor n=1 Tax=Ramlibacter tataouinensis TaxID=94132 RepID=UPI0022F389EF|nr:TonB-dependent siderophore receptor [Ramlibacter tataouinensis]WBY02168.1 TonB-dependent siderophore receptor [Ramlibacter tataouinensis]
MRPLVITPAEVPAAADVTGFGDFPRKEVPVSTTVITGQEIDDSGARRLADLTRFDSSVSDAYNAPGYWDFLSIRGFTLNNQFNYRREGLPINAETTIPLDNKERIEVLKGTSGIQAGTSAPGGLVNYVVKRPTARPLREVRLEASQRGSLLGAVDLGGRFGVDDAFGYRLNAAQERLRPLVRNTDGERSLLALAADWRASRDALVEAEIEWSRHGQPSQTGFSLLGNVLPGPVDPRLNLNNQPWLQRSQFDALTGTLRFTQALGSNWRWTAQLGTQRLETDDFTAFPFGCSAEGNFDRFCSDGTFDYYDFRSQDERRRRDAAAGKLAGSVQAGGVTHELSGGVLRHRTRDRFNPQAFNLAGTGTIDGLAVVPPSPVTGFIVPDRDEHTTEFHLQDAVRWNDRLTTWLGVRHTRLDRGYRQSLTTPWAAVSYKLGDQVAYGSWGEGVESWQVTTDPLFALANAGQVLPAAKSRQAEVGLRGGDAALGWQVALFQVRRPMTNFDFCTRTFACAVGQYDGSAVHRGLEASAQWTQGPWRLQGGATLLRARREGSVYEPATNGQQPVNVPEVVLRGSAAYRLAAVPGLELQGHVSHEGSRPVLADGSVSIPSWTRLDAALRYERRIGAADTTWTVGVHNLLDRRYWRESPTQFAHVYLYPGAPRTLRVSFAAAF